MNAMLQPRFQSKVHPRKQRAWHYERDAETLPRERLERLQLRRLRATLKNAFDNVPLHRKRMQAAGLRPGDIRSLEDLALLPFTLKSDLRDHYPFGMFARPRASLARVHASSGTTGKPTVVGYTLKDIDTWATVMARSIRAAGGRAGDIVHVSYGYGLFTGGLGARWSAWTEIDQLRASKSALEIENGNFRASTGELTTQIQSLESVIEDLGARAALDPAQARAMDRLPAVVKARAAGGGAQTSAALSSVLSTSTVPGTWRMRVTISSPAHPRPALAQRRCRTPLQPSAR